MKISILLPAFLTPLTIRLSSQAQDSLQYRLRMILPQ